MTNLLLSWKSWQHDSNLLQFLCHVRKIDDNPQMPDPFLWEWEWVTYQIHSYDNYQMMQLEKFWHVALFSVCLSALGTMSTTQNGWNFQILLLAHVTDMPSMPCCVSAMTKGQTVDFQLRFDELVTNCILHYSRYWVWHFEV